MIYHQSAQSYYSKLAKKHNFKFVELSEEDVDLSLLDLSKNEKYLKLQAIPIKLTKEKITIATADPTQKNRKNILDFFLDETEKDVKIVVMSRQNISKILANKFSREFTHQITYERHEMDPVHNASYTFSFLQGFVLISIILLVIAGFIWKPWATKFLLLLLFSCGTTFIISYKVGLSISAFFLKKHKPFVKDVELEKLPKTNLPIYTILVPLLWEKKETVTLLLEALERIKYPKSKLDVKLLLEQDDKSTLEVLNKFTLPWYFDLCLVPKGLPRTKPRACNYGLKLAYGEYLVIYDAEDQPHPYQLLKAVAMFKEKDEQLVCIQAPLNFYNYKDNILTRLFAIEFTHWFDAFVPALVYLRAAVPLGGTSNHFKVNALRELGAWDPYVGTEDAEIGVRIYRMGYRTQTYSLTTYEEANSRLVNWFNQRVRWNKGYMQTYLVNMRDPLHLFRALGAKRFMHFQCFVGGNVFRQFANLPLWAMFIIMTFFNDSIFGLKPTPPSIFYTMWGNFLFSNIVLITAEFVAVYKRGLYSLLIYTPLRLFYYTLTSFSGYWAIIDLLVRPSFWYKTEHGLRKNYRNFDVKLP